MSQNCGLANESCRSQTCEWHTGGSFSLPEKTSGSVFSRVISETIAGSEHCQQSNEHLFVGVLDRQSHLAFVAVAAGYNFQTHRVFATA